MTRKTLASRISPAAAITAIFIILAAAMSLYLYSNMQSKINNHLAETTATQEIAWKASLKMHRTAMEFWYNEYVMTPTTLSFIRQAQDSGKRNAARQGLYQHLHKTYAAMHGKGVQQLHFHLPHGVSLLRFHNPGRYGDQLFGFRHTVRTVNEQLKPIFGFEAGRHASGFRSVFPIIDQGQHLGSVEISIPFKIIQRDIGSLISNSNFELILHRLALKELHKEQSSLYTVWPGSNDFFMESTPSEKLHKLPELANAIKTSPSAQQALKQDRSGSIYLEQENSYFALTLTVAENILGESIGFLVGFRKDPLIKTIRNDFLRDTTISLVLLAAACMAVWLFIRYRQKNDSQNHGPQPECRT